MHAALRHLAGLGMILALGGCSLLDMAGARSSESPDSAPAPAPVAAPPPPRPAVVLAPRSARALPLPPSPAPGRGPEIRLVGLSRGETQALLGTPAVESERSPAKVWQYHQGDCSVDVYFYLDVARNEFYALHYETRAPVANAGGTSTSAGSSAEWCLERVHDAHRSR